MPELPEVEVLVRHLAPLIQGRRIQGVEVRRAKVIAPTAEGELRERLVGARFTGLERRGKFLVFAVQPKGRGKPFSLIGHLGMTGRMYVREKTGPIPKHAAVILDLGHEYFVYEDTRYFGRLTLDASSLAGLGPEPRGDQFTPEYLAGALKRSSQPVKVKLLDQSMVAGVG
ncbi:MAG TPA: DNA-formamidopyrimidine glycosylase family protein, partial [Verrucomicrobiae bacterium]|nr:DNA-formamidopyrimidine glycosylase family protein [Verrucomicrobiae bacterium]